ncbi:MAG: CAP domain-containing protein [Gemmatimonadota bacterium]
MRRAGEGSGSGRPGRTARFVVIPLALSVVSLGLAAEGTAQSGPEARLHELVNHHREAAGCPPLLWHEPSAAVAEGRSADMVRRGYFDHRTPDGSTVFDEVAEAGIEAYGSIAENIALTQSGPASVMELWRESSPHRRNLDDCSFTHHGLGEREGVWTQILLARPKPGVSSRPAGPDPPPPTPPG